MGTDPADGTGLTTGLTDTLNRVVTIVIWVGLISFAGIALVNIVPRFFGRKG